MGSHVEARRAGQGAGDRGVEFQRHPSRALRGRAARRFPAAAFFTRAPRGGGGRDPMVPCARHRGHCLQPHAVGPAHASASRKSGSPRCPRTTGAAAAPSSSRRVFRPTCRCGMRCVPLAERRGVSVGALAIAWTLAWPGMTGAIVGARSPEQVDGWIAGASLALDSGELDAIAAAVARTQAGHGPARPQAA